MRRRRRRRSGSPAGRRALVSWRACVAASVPTPPMAVSGEGTMLMAAWHLGEEPRGRRDQRGCVRCRGACRECRALQAAGGCEFRALRDSRRQHPDAGASTDAGLAQPSCQPVTPVPAALLYGSPWLVAASLGERKPDRGCRFGDEPVATCSALTSASPQWDSCGGAATADACLVSCVAGHPW